MELAKTFLVMLIMLTRTVVLTLTLMETMKKTLWRNQSPDAMKIVSVDASNGLVLTTICTEPLNLLLL